MNWSLAIGKLSTGRYDGEKQKRKGRNIWIKDTAVVNAVRDFLKIHV